MISTCMFYVSGAQACVLAFSTVDRDSFEAIESWKKKVSYSAISVLYLKPLNDVSMVV